MSYNNGHQINGREKSLVFIIQIFEKYKKTKSFYIHHRIIERQP
jgi:hypothetical protein